MNQRALEASALAMLKWMHGAQAEFEQWAPGIKAGLIEQTQECITAYEAHLKAEGFVVAPVEATAQMLAAAFPTDGRDDISTDDLKVGAEAILILEGAADLGSITGPAVREAAAMRKDYRAMLSAATTGENDASDR